MKKLLLAILSLCFANFLYASVPPQIAASQGSLAPMLQKVLPSVVNIVCVGESAPGEEDNKTPSSQHAPERSQKPQGFVGVGSGVIVDGQKGYILTNNHVIAHADKIVVNLNDGRRFNAKLIGHDDLSDIAVLQIKAANLNSLPFSDSNHLRVGDFVVAIGNPFGLSQTVTSGIVSALERSDLHIGNTMGYESFIQTDAPINPGNSGGALVNMQGELVGINTAILSPNMQGGSVGIGFAIPANMAKAVMNQLIQFGALRRGLIGVGVQNLSPALAKNLKLSGTDGALIAQVTPGSPADKAGLKAGDVIVAVNGSRITNAAQARNAIGLMPMGSHVKLDLLRDGEPEALSLNSANPAAFQQQDMRNNRFFYGTTMQNFDAQLPLLGHVKGVEILQLTENTPAWHAALSQGDVITAANKTPITSMEDLSKIANETHGELLLNVLKGDNSALFVVVRADNSEESD